MSASARHVVVTGLGPVTAVGSGVPALEEGLRAARSPIRAASTFDVAAFRSRMAAELRDFDATAYLDAKQARRLDRFVQLTLASAHLAVDDAGVSRDMLAGARTAVMMGSAMGGIAHAETQLRAFISDGARAIDPRIATTTFAGAASCHIAIEYGITGPNATNAMSCAAGTMAIGEAARLIRTGEVDVALAGGADAPLAPVCYGAFASMRAMSKRNDEPERACRPFDRDRDGFVMGEGACVLVLEEAEHARARGAHVYAEIGGYASNNDAYHMAAPLPDGSRAAACMSATIEAGGLTPGDIDHVNAHGSSTPLNDSTESSAVRQALGPRADHVSVTATKPYHGHALGASGAIEAAIACLSIRDGWVPPVLNLEQPGEDCDLDYVTDPAGRDQPVRAVLSNSFGFGGINAVLLLVAPDQAG
ncbi:MAG: beta-ketoacyl-[acyl-carrier-protein] synthase family protein [Gemmatimonadota bacterium]|nr:beta-ketoacyl-[acyl-carrier-protein] synthase family protein [Gemmatimonadota bacterium]